MRFRLFSGLLLSLLAAQSAQGVIIDGKDWRQLTETTGFSWLIANNSCRTGVCSGSIGSVSLDGWTWATQGEVQGLFETLVKPGSTQFPSAGSSYAAVNDADIANAVRTLFDPTWIFNLGARQYLEVRGLTRGSTGAYTTTMAYLSDSPFDSGLDYAAFDTSFPKNSGSANTGLWLYKPATSVPEPATLALLGFGLLSVGVMRRRRAG